MHLRTLLIIIMHEHYSPMCYFNLHFIVQERNTVLLRVTAKR